MVIRSEKIDLFQTLVHDISVKSKSLDDTKTFTVFSYSNDTLMGVDELVFFRRLAGFGSSEIEVSALLRGLATQFPMATKLELLEVALSRESVEFDPGLSSFARQFNKRDFVFEMVDHFKEHQRKFYREREKTAIAALLTFRVYLLALWFIRYESLEFNLTILKRDNYYERWIDDLIQMQESDLPILSNIQSADIVSKFSQIEYDLGVLPRSLKDISPNIYKMNDYLLDLRNGKIRKLFYDTN